MRNITPRTPHPTTLSLPSSSTLVPDLIGDPGHLRGSRVFAFFIREDKDSGSPIGVGDDRGEVLAGFRPRTPRGRMRGFGPARRDPFVSAKGPKTIGARARPFGCLCPSPERFGLRNSLRSDSPRPQLDFGTGAQPRPQAP